MPVTVDPACADAFFDLYVENRRTDGTYADTNVDIADDWDNLSFTYTPALAVAITLDLAPGSTVSAISGEASEPKQEERCKLAKDEVDGVTGGRPPVHVPPQ